MNVTYKVRLRNRYQPEPLAANESVELYLQPTEHIPLDGIVKDTARKIIGGESHPDKKARLVYEWIVKNTFRDPAVRGCGLGDIKTLLISGNLRGKCADLSSLFVGLCRAAGVPAREVFGLRVLPSELSKSIGKVGEVTKAQHCRAEYFVAHKGWIPVDPADVRKVVLEENLDLKNSHVQYLRKKLFGFWEMNWIAYNSARDCALPPQYSKNINYLMYPLSVSGATEKDGMDADQFKYTITSKPLLGLA